MGTILHGLTDAERQAAYGADITYGTNNEFGFDYLRDNMKFDRASLVQRELNYAIVDEVDSILIDEARTPLIISGPAEKSTDLYYQVNNIIPQARRRIAITRSTRRPGPRPSPRRGSPAARRCCRSKICTIRKLHRDAAPHQQALKAHALFKRDVDYIVKDGEVIIVDEFTGRLMPGRRYSEGLHQALEAKEGVKIENENQTLATITFQNYFRMYNKLAGMTGTADTEAAEFKKIYNLDVVVAPTHKPMVRTDYPGRHLQDQAREVRGRAGRDRGAARQGPAGAGGHHLDRRFRAAEQEAEGARDPARGPERQASREGGCRSSPRPARKGWSPSRPTWPAAAPTSSWARAWSTWAGCTSSAPSGTNPGASTTSCAAARAVRGTRAPRASTWRWKTICCASSAGERITGIMEKLGMKEGEPIEHNLISRAIENAQSKVEGHNFEIRKHLLEYDDVMNQQREVIYGQRREILMGKDLQPQVIWRWSPRPPRASSTVSPTRRPTPSTGTSRRCLTRFTSSSISGRRN